MAKRKYKVQVDEELLSYVIEKPMVAFKIVKKAEIPVPKKASFLLLKMNLTELTIEYRFHLSEESFVQDYAITVGRGKPFVETINYVRQEKKGPWEFFTPPPVIGTDVMTRLRMGS